jgi:hypothetical protein
MGTSKNYPSPNTPRWNAVRSGYKNGAIPVDRVSAEVWRAATSENQNLESMISSDLVFRCHQIVSSASSAIDAYKEFNKEILVSKANSLVTEFAKRAIVQSFHDTDNPSASWRGNFVAELTDYFVSRDIAGYFGADCRNKNVTELLAFRKDIKQIVGRKVNEGSVEINSPSEWQSYVGRSMNLLKNKG